MALLVPPWCIFRSIYIKDEVIIVQNNEVQAKIQLSGPLGPYDATDGQA
jgi:hypothetical protein